MGGMSEQDVLHVTFEPPIIRSHRTLDSKSWIPRFHLRTFLSVQRCQNTEEDYNMRKIQVLLPEEMITYLQSIVESGETESMSQTIRKIIMKEMKANETQ